MSQRVDATDPNDRERAIEIAASAVDGGRLVVLPTDTVYGIGCDAFDNQAVEALLRAKGRGSTCQCQCWSAAGTRSRV